MGNKINKMAFSSDEQNIFNNIVALLNELKTLGMQDDGEEEMISEQMEMTEAKQENQTDRPPEDENEIDKTEKGLEQTPSEGSTANDDAGVRDEENLTDLTEENMDEVAKALLTLLKGKTKTQKSVVKKESTNQLLPVLNELTKAIKSIGARQEESENALESILKGLGVAKAIESEEKKVEKSRPVKSNKELEGLLTYVEKALGKENKIEDEEVIKTFMGKTNQNAMARKSLSKFLPGLIQGDK